jgi:hypothetical protein
MAHLAQLNITRLARFRRHDATAEAFGFSERFPPPA